MFNVGLHSRGIRIGGPGSGPGGGAGKPNPGGDLDAECAVCSGSGGGEGSPSGGGGGDTLPPVVALSVSPGGGGDSTAVCPAEPPPVGCTGGLIAIAVNVLASDNGPLTSTVTLDGPGRFSATGPPTVTQSVPPGKYLLSVSASGYVGQSFVLPRFPEDLNVCTYPTLVVLDPV